MTLTTDLRQIELEAFQKENENNAFKDFLRAQGNDVVDASVHELNNIITPQINCTACGNCCRQLMINVTEEEVEDVAAHLNMEQEQLKEKYIETSLQGDMIVNTIPCHFLQGNCCSIYKHRFNECREFPGLQRNNFTQRLFATFMHYGRCPIIYNVIEALKIKLGFIKQPAAL